MYLDTSPSENEKIISAKDQILQSLARENIRAFESLKKLRDRAGGRAQLLAILDDADFIPAVQVIRSSIAALSNSADTEL